MHAGTDNDAEKFAVTMEAMSQMGISQGRLPLSSLPALLALFTTFYELGFIGAALQGRELRKEGREREREETK